VRIGVEYLEVIVLPMLNISSGNQHLLIFSQDPRGHDEAKIWLAPGVLT